MASRRPRRRLTLSLLPLMDVIFLVLAVFLVRMLDLAPRKEVPLVLPKSRHGTAIQEGFLTLSITSEGEYLLGGEPLELAEIRTQLEALQTRGELSKVRISGARAAHLEHFVALMDLLKDLGVRSTTLETESQ